MLVRCQWWPYCPCGNEFVQFCKKESGPNDPWDPSHSGPFLDEVDEEDDVYEPEDYTGDYPLEIEGEDDE